MRPFRKLSFLALGLAGGVLALYGARIVRENLKGDPLAQFRAPRESEYPDNLGLRLTNVRVRRYVGKTVQTEFTVGRADVEKNRNVFALYGIKDGVHRHPKGEFRFAAGNGRYNAYGNLLNLAGRVTLKSKDFDLASKRVDYDGQSKRLTALEGVRGKALGGVVRAERVAYDIEREAFTSGPAMWRGRPPAKYLASLGLPASLQRSEWQVEGDSFRVLNGIEVYGNGTASDREQIIKAPKVTRDKKTDVIVATGGVRYWSGKANFVADKATIIRKEKRVVLEGNVRMLVKTKADEAKGPKVEELPPYTALPPDKVTAGKALPTPTQVEKVRSGKSVRDYPLVMVGAKVDYSYAKGSRLAIITGSPQARQELGEGAWRQVWTNTARYDAENEILRLNGTKGKGDARLKNSIGDDLTANWFELSTAEGEDEYSGEGIRGTVTTTEDEVPAGGGTKPPPRRR